MKMTKKFDKLNESFGIGEDPIVPEVETTPVEVINEESIEESEKTPEIKKDYKYTRNQLYSLIEKGQDAINGILELAAETEQPRAYEVALQLIKNVADTTDKLMDLQKKLKDVEEDTKQKGPTNVTNALFVGSTAELTKLLKNNQQEEDTK